MKRLEADLGTALFVRTTRSMHLSVAGERLLARCRPLLDGLRAAEYELRAGGNAIEGRRQVSPAVRVLREFLAERVTAMVKA